MPTSTDGSRLFPRELFTSPEGVATSVNAIRTVSEHEYDITGFALAPRNPFNVDNAVNPAVRHTLGHFSTSFIFPDYPTPAQLMAGQADLMKNVLDG